MDKVVLMRFYIVSHGAFGGAKKKPNESLLLAGSCTIVLVWFVICGRFPANNSQSSCQVFHPIMQSELINEALKTIKVPHILINVISRRVRQLTLGHRQLVESRPGTGFSDIALMEVIQGKITFETTTEFNAEPRVGQVTNLGFFNKKRAA